MTSHVALADEYLSTAQQVFEGCGMDGSGALPVNTLMEKFAPYIPADKSEDLLALLDPESTNPSISSAELATALEKYGERQHTKLDFDDSIILRNGNTPIDSDSGISTDMGYQLLDELQTELRDKRHTERRLQVTLEAAERAHEDALAAVTAERDSLRAHLQLMREENSALAQLRGECEESAERLQAAESALESRGRELDAARRKLRAAHGALDKLETERATLQGLLAETKAECHRINDKFAARQAKLLEENEAYKSDYADLATRFQEQSEHLQQTQKEKELLEMELSDVQNKSAAPPFDRSVDVSYTDAQLLHALHSLHLDGDPRAGRFDESISQDELYISDCKVERGRPSLFDELLRVDSFHRHLPDVGKCEETTCDVAAQTDLSEDAIDNSGAISCGDCTRPDEEICDHVNSDDEVCTDCVVTDEKVCNKQVIPNEKICNNRVIPNEKICNNRVIPNEKICNNQMIPNEKICNNQVIPNEKICNNRVIPNESNNQLIPNEIICNNQVIPNEKICNNQVTNENVCDNYLNPDDNICNDCVNSNANICTNSFVPDEKSSNKVLSSGDRQTCPDCAASNTRIKELETIMIRSEKTIKDMRTDLTHYENNLIVLQSNFDCGEERNKRNQGVIELLRSKLESFQTASKVQTDLIEKKRSNVRCVETQTFDWTADVATQADRECVECERRSVADSAAVVTGSARVKNFLWEALKGVLQLLALLCLGAAVLFLYNVCHYSYAARRCVRGGNPVPWQWIRVEDLLNFLFRIEYVGEIPM